MKSVARERHILLVLKKAKNKLFRAILRHCDDKLIQTLAEIIHNVISGNIEIDQKIVRKLKRYKSQLRKLHLSIKKRKCLKQRRRLLIKQDGGIWPLLLEAALAGLTSYGGEKLAEYGSEAIKKLF